MTRKRSVKPFQKSAENFYIGGVHPVELALSAGRVRHLWVKDAHPLSSRLHSLLMKGEKGKVATEFVPHSVLDRLYPGNHQGIVAEISPRPLMELGAILTLSSRRFLLALDHLTDPQNMGAILRSAAAFQVDAVLFPTHRQSPLTPAVYKASAGYVEFLNLVQVANLRYSLAFLRKRGYSLVGLDNSAPAPLDAASIQFPLCLVVGGEGKGITPVVRKELDETYRIPMAEGVESLNVSTATAIALYSLSRKLLPIQHGS